MSNDNLILFPKKSNSVLGMSETELKWAISGTLLLILALSMGLNGAIFQPVAEQKMLAQSQQQSRDLASVPAIVNIAWEKRAFEVLKNSEERDVASVGKNPGPFDRLSFGVLEGKYAIQMTKGKIANIYFADKTDSTPKIIANRTQFLKEYQGLIAPDAAAVKAGFADSNGEQTLEMYELTSTSGEVLATVEFRLDGDERLISMKVQ